MPREKIKFALRIMPETQQLVKDYYPLDNCQNQSEFIEKAIRFYAGYVASKNGTEFLAPILVSALQSTIKNMENHFSRLQFKTAVELNMMMNVLASELDTAPETLDQMRDRCIQEVKETCGEITFKDAVKYQRIG
jgi:hypothetical protein